jgi:hypothetical protein
MLRSYDIAHHKVETMNLNHLKRFILISGTAIALSTATTKITAQTAPSPSANPPATSPDGRPVRAYNRNTEVNAINNRIRAAARQGKSWVTNPLEIFTTLEGDLTDIQYSLYLRPENGNPEGEGAPPTAYTLTYVISGFRDDSVAGKWKQYKFRGCQPGECPSTPNTSLPILLIQEIRTANYCRRPNSEFYSSNPCP